MYSCWAMNRALVINVGGSLLSSYSRVIANITDRPQMRVVVFSLIVGSACCLRCAVEGYAPVAVF